MQPWSERITSDPNICHGQPCIRGTRVLVSVVLDNLAEGFTAEQVTQEYPPLTVADVRAALSYAAAQSREKKLAPETSRIEKLPISTRVRVVLCLIGSVVVPMATESACLVLWHRYGWLWGWGGGWWFILASVAGGAACLAALPMPWPARFSAIILYAIPAAYLVFHFAICFDGYVYNNWL
jgi:uncharacterized protein (DUF433 family)